MWSHGLPEGSWRSNKSSIVWKVKLLGNLGQWRRRIMVTYFILYFCQTWNSSLCSAVTCAQVRRWWVAFPLWEGVEIRLWGDRMVSEVHEHVLSIFQWHPDTSASTESLGPNSVDEKNVVFSPNNLELKCVRQTRKREFSPLITKRDFRDLRSQILLPNIAGNNNLWWDTDRARESNKGCEQLLCWHIRRHSPRVLEKPLLLQAGSTWCPCSCFQTSLLVFTKLVRLQCL